MKMKSISLTLFSVLLISTQSQAIPLYSADGHIATDVEIDVFSFDNVQKDAYARTTSGADVLTTKVEYSHNTSPNRPPGSAFAFGSASLSVQFGSMIGVSSWSGVQPQPWFGHGGTVSSIISAGAFTIPDITISYRGVEPEGNQAGQGYVPASLHVSTDIHGEGRHVVDLGADFTGDTSGRFQPKRVIDVTDGPISISDKVTSFTGYTLPVGDLFDLHLQAIVQSLSMPVPNLIHEVGSKSRSVVNWKVELGGSPAFILPEGYYANSADGSIKDNYFVGTTASTGPVGVPEPSSLLLVGVAALAGLIRRRSFLKV